MAEYKHKYDFVTEDGELAIMNGIAVKDLKKDEVLISYGKFLQLNASDNTYYGN